MNIFVGTWLATAAMRLARATTVRATGPVRIGLVAALYGQSAASGTAISSNAFLHGPDRDDGITCIPTCLTPGETPKYPPSTSGGHLRAQAV